MKEELRCSHCGAPFVTTATHGIVVCTYCRVGRVNLGPAPSAPEKAAAVEVPKPPVPTPPPAPVKNEVPVSSSGGVSSAEILRVAKECLQGADSVFFAPEIPKEKEDGARASYANRIPAEEPLLVLYDATVFGGADDGFVFTPQRFGWKNLGEDPETIAWEVLPSKAIELRDGQLEIVGKTLFFDEELLGRLLPALQRLAGRKPTNPYRTSSALSFGELLAAAQAALGTDPSLFYAGSIPPEKEKGARAAYGALLQPNEPIVALYDATLFGGADDGFLLLERGLGWKNIVMDPKVVAWDALVSKLIQPDGTTVKLQNDELQLAADTEQFAVKLAGFLRQLAKG